ncbi:outer membrane beta-barrel protein [Sphingobacterium sp. Mn56C]|uniref:outer membrane beta-barrel protein n=1 Tax=Sphingobacterium sp. Mn56C TaxID=3395261 RepID=UPI003BCEDB07
MKKLLLTLTAVAGLTAASQAQEFGFGKGNVIVEGNLGLSTTNNKESKTKQTDFKFTPKVGYFLTDKVAVGINLHANTANTKNTATSVEQKTNKNELGAGVFGRYYFLELGSRFKAYGELNADYTSLKSDVTTGGNKVKSPKVNNIGVNAGIGANYFLTEKIAVNFAFANVVGFNSSKASGSKATTNFGANINQYNNFFDAATFGLTFKF